MKQELLSHGILGYLQNPEHAADSVDNVTEILGVSLYQSKTRQALIDFCGWFQNRSKTVRKNKKLEDKCTLISKLEAHIRGGDMRACVMAASHFDFAVALAMSSFADSKQQRKRFNESQSNINLFQKLLKELGTLLEKSTARQEIDNLRAINRDIYKEASNPYLRLFLILALERDSYRELFSQLVERDTLNLFDYVTLALKYLDKDSLIAFLKRKAQSSVTTGLLDAVPLLGLESPDIVRALQAFNDETSDLQTCAYVAAYACCQHYVKASDGKQDRLIKPILPLVAPFKKFIQAYRDYLNQLQLWNVRADFDVA